MYTLSRTTIALLSVSAVLLLGACESVTAPPGEESPELAASASASGLPSVGDLLRAQPGEPCATGPHRDFDFWVGEWDVTNNATGQEGSTNRVENLLDGCLIAENWTAANGSRGRSLNSYDADIGMWRQTWVPANPLGIIRMAGGLDAEGVMTMDGERITAGGIAILDHYEWEVVEPGVVEQRGRRQIPAIGLDNSFALTYRPALDFEPVPENPSAACQPGGVGEGNREADFLLGDWQVAAADGPNVGDASISSDLSGCLFEERFTSVGGLSSIAFLYYDPFVGQWYRTYVDNRGERIEMTGNFEAGALVLTGTEPAPNGGEIELRVTWSSDGLGLRQTVEASRDGGASWKESLDLRYEPATD